MTVQPSDSPEPTTDEAPPPTAPSAISSEEATPATEPTPAAAGDATDAASAVEEAPAAAEAAVPDAPAEAAPADDAAAEEPAEEATTGEAAAEEATTEEAPVEAPAEAPADTAAAEEPPAEASAEEATTEEAPAAEAFVEQPSPGDEPGVTTPATDEAAAGTSAPAEDAGAAAAQAAGAVAEEPETTPAEVAAAAQAGAAADTADKGHKGEKADDGKKAKKKKQKPSAPDPAAIVKRIGTTSEEALAYVADPDPKLSRMARKHREAVISEIPPVTAGALLGPDALCRHFLASAASGRYTDLFHLWELFKAFPDDCKPVLASRQKAQEKAKKKLATATHLGLLGSSADRVAADIDRASGLPWRWLKEVLEPMGPAIRQRPVVLAAMLRRDPGYTVELPEEPNDRWLAEAASLRESGADVPDVIDGMLSRFAERLPATLATLRMAHEQYPDRVPALIDRVDLEARDIGAIMAWARDHGHGDQLTGRVATDVAEAATSSRAEGLARWTTWSERGVTVDMPESLMAPTLEGLDLGRPESAVLVKRLVDAGADMDPQAILDGVAADNRMLGEKAYEAFVCAGFDEVHLPLLLEGNPMVKAETRCPACQAWTWVRPGHEARCPREGYAVPGEHADAEASVDAAVATLVSGADVTPAEPVAAGERPAAAPPPPAAEAPTEPAPAAESPAPEVPADTTPAAETSAEAPDPSEAPSR